MRYSKEHKQATHERLVEAASQQFRAHGGDGISIADLMDELQLTHGGFYRHFASKEDLYAEALTFSFAQKLTSLLEKVHNDGTTPPLKVLINQYLSLEHCANRVDGCPVAALSAEIARQPLVVRETFDQGLRTYMAQISPLLPGATETERTHNALVLFSGMAGALSLARAVADQALQAEILGAARELYTKVYCSS
ncbi:MAG: TetR/AcrR family transcriptional regulator [Chloroflexi bacterium]|nr:TetR/AcrR family transcriptional regulator [Chloroflexota bacterium]